MFRAYSTARRLCLVLLLLVIAALCVPTSQASAAPLGQARQLVDVAGSALLLGR
jgi:hypothetical protein